MKLIKLTAISAAVLASTAALAAEPVVVVDDNFADSRATGISLTGVDTSVCITGADNLFTKLHLKLGARFIVETPTGVQVQNRHLEGKKFGSGQRVLL